MANNSLANSSPTPSVNLQVWMIEGPAFSIVVPRHGLLHHLGRQTPWTLSLMEPEQALLKGILEGQGLTVTILPSYTPTELKMPECNGCLVCSFFEPVLGCLSGCSKVAEPNFDLCPLGRLPQ